MSDWSEFIEQQTDRPDEAFGGEGYIAVTEDVIVELVGEDAAKLLQGQVTADIDKLASGEFVFAALCTNKGRVVSAFALYRSEQSFYCRLPSDNANQFIQTLKKYAVFYKVEISVRADLAILVVLQRPLPVDFPKSFAKLSYRDQLVELWIEQSEWAPALASLSKLARVSENHWQLLKIQFGWPDIRVETSEIFLPHALSLDLADAISFTKGCYTGQEIVARTHYRGKSKKRLIRMWLDGAAPAPGTELESTLGISIGTVVMSAYLAEGKSEILASASLDLPAEGELLIDGSKMSYNIRPLPWQTQ